MNDLSNTPVTPAPAEPVADALASLRLQFQATLIILIMISGALDLYLLRQYTTTRKEVAAFEQIVGQMITNYQQATVPLANKFLGQLTEYAKTHPDFQPVLRRYNVQPASGVMAPAPAPAATKTPAPKQ